MHNISSYIWCFMWGTVAMHWFMFILKMLHWCIAPRLTSSTLKMLLILSVATQKRAAWMRWFIIHTGLARHHVFVALIWTRCSPHTRSLRLRNSRWKSVLVNLCWSAASCSRKSNSVSETDVFYVFQTTSTPILDLRFTLVEVYKCWLAGLGLSNVCLHRGFPSQRSTGMAFPVQIQLVFVQYLKVSSSEKRRTGSLVLVLRDSWLICCHSTVWVLSVLLLSNEMWRYCTLCLTHWIKPLSQTRILTFDLSTATMHLNLYERIQTDA